MYRILPLLYVGLCCIILLQLIRIVLNGHNVENFQFVFLTLCFIWTLLRSLFWYVVNLGTWPVWLITGLHILPSVCQISTFSLIILYQAKLVHRNRWNARRSKFISFYVVANTVMVMLTVLISGLADVQTRVSDDTQNDDLYNSTEYLDRMYYLTSSIYFGVLIILATFQMCKLYRSNTSNALIPNNSTRSPRSAFAILIFTLLFFMFLSRAIYDFCLALNLGGNVLPNMKISQSNISRKNKRIPLAAFFLYVLWEIVPTILVLFFFRKIPSNNDFGLWAKFTRVCFKKPLQQNSPNDSSSSPSCNIQQSLVLNVDSTTDEWKYTPSPHNACFDDPLRYDSETDITWVTGDSFIRTPLSEGACLDYVRGTTEKILSKSLF